MKKLDKKALRRSIWSSLSRLIGIGLGAGAGGLIKQLVGDGLQGWAAACGMAIASFVLMLYAEYEREVEIE